MATPTDAEPQASLSPVRGPSDAAPPDPPEQLSPQELRTSSMDSEKSAESTTEEPEYMVTLREQANRQGQSTWVERAPAAISASRVALNAATYGTQIGFDIAKKSTKIGFDIARSLISFGVGVGGSIVDHAYGFDGGVGSDRIGQGPTATFLRDAVGKGVNAVEFMTMFGIEVGKGVTMTSLVAANTSVASLESVFGNDEALRALEVFAQLVRREWSTPMEFDPPGGISQFTLFEVAKAGTTWAALQSVTTSVYGARIRGELEEVDLRVWRGDTAGKEGDDKEGKDGEETEILFDFNVTEEEVLDSDRGEIISAEINSSSGDVAGGDGSGGSGHSARMEASGDGRGLSGEDNATRLRLRRYSKLCLGSYGGLGMVFFGVPVPSVLRTATEAVGVTAKGTGQSGGQQHARAEEIERRLEEREVANAAQHMVDSTVVGEDEVPAALDGQRRVAADTSIGRVPGEFGHGDDAAGADSAGVASAPTPQSNAESASTSAASASAADAKKVEPEFKLWDLLTGRHDVTLMERMGELEPGGVKIGGPNDAEEDDDEESDDEGDLPPSQPPTTTRSGVSKYVHAETSSKATKKKPAKVEAEKKRRHPRYFVISDHSTKTVILCLRGTLSVDDLATDLTCEPSIFDSSQYWDSEAEEEVVEGEWVNLTPPGQAPSENVEPSETTPQEKPQAGGGAGDKFEVHGGIYEIALGMASKDGPVTKAIARALKANPDYELHVVGHSLGAGLGGLIALMWTNPTTCRTSTKSGLPPGRPVKAFGFAPPCTTDARLSRKCKSLIHSFAYSNDIVPRLSLGHIQDIRTAAAWLCYANRDNPGENCNNIMSRIIAYKRGRLDEDLEQKMDEEAWFTSIRTTLEANMHSATLFPPGDVYWLVKDNDLSFPDDDKTGTKGHRLFRVTGKVEVVFSQILHARNMLSCHLPQMTMSAIHDHL